MFGDYGFDWPVSNVSMGIGPIQKIIEASKSCAIRTCSGSHDKDVNVYRCNAAADEVKLLDKTIG